MIEQLVDEAIAKYALQDTGLWEYRTMPRHYTFSKAMCWVAANRGAELATVYGRPERAATWAAGPAAARAHPARGLQRVARLLHSSLRRPAPRRVEPAAAHAGPARCAGSPLRLHRPRLRARAGRPRADAALPARRRFRRDDQRVHDLFVLVGRGAGDDGRSGRGDRTLQQILAYANPLGLFSEDVEPATAACSATSRRRIPTWSLSTPLSPSGNCSTRARSISGRGRRGGEVQVLGSRFGSRSPQSSCGVRSASWARLMSSNCVEPGRRTP